MGLWPDPSGLCLHSYENHRIRATLSILLNSQLFDCKILGARTIAPNSMLRRMVPGDAKENSRRPASPFLCLRASCSTWPRFPGSQVSSNSFYHLQSCPFSKGNGTKRFERYLHQHKFTTNAIPCTKLGFAIPDAKPGFATPGHQHNSQHFKIPCCSNLGQIVLYSCRDRV